MSINKEITNSFTFWNQSYKGAEVNLIPLKVPSEMEQIFKKFLLNGTSLIDYGCGDGFLLAYSVKNSNIKRAYGIENGNYIVEYASKVIKGYGLDDKITILDNGLKALESFKEESIDRIQISNVLDVITASKAQQIMDGLLRVLSKDGLLFLKINPEFSNQELINKGFINFKDNLFSKNDVLRCRNLTTEEWKEYLSQCFTIIDFALAPYQGPGYLDRLFLLKKK